MTTIPDHVGRERTVKTPEQIAAGLRVVHLDTLDCLANGNSFVFVTRSHDRVRQKLRKLGLIAYCGKPKRWRITDEGEAVRAILQEQADAK